MQFWRAAHFITVGKWSDAIDVGYGRASLPVPHLSERSPRVSFVVDA